MKFRQETSLPSPAASAPFYTPDCFYLIGQLGTGNDICEIYITDNNGNLKKVGNTPMIQDVVNASLSGVGSINIVGTFNALPTPATASSNEFYLVSDASGDPTVNSGAAMYILDAANDIYIKVTEFESLNENLSLDWSQIVNGPTSTPASIDQSVANSHSHANKPQLDGFTTDGDNDLAHTAGKVCIQTVNNW